MNTPPFLISAALLFWGWHAGLLFLASVCAILLEASRLVHRRWEFSTSVLCRVWDLCAVLFLAAFIFHYAAETPIGVLMGTVQWLPPVFLPIMAAQAYGEKDKMEYSVFFLLLRRMKGRRKMPQEKTLNISWCFFAVCVVSASVTEYRTPWFFIGLCCLAAWALWSARPGRYSAWTWLALLIIAMASGYGGGTGLPMLQRTLEQKFVDMYAQYLMGRMDPFKTRTAIGEVGALKLSNSILFRVEDLSGSGGPLLLMESAYNVYLRASWFAIRSPFASESTGPDGATWSLQEISLSTATLSISAWLRRGQGILSLPKGTMLLEGLPVGRLCKNRMGAVKVEKGPDLVTYRVSTAANSSLQGAPDETDLEAPPDDASAVSAIAGELGLGSMPPAEALNTIKSYFQKNFKYSLDLKRKNAWSTPLDDFLLRVRSGHCEYFATATVLLLRKAGIPARYAVGYMASEYSGLEKKLIVRGTDAHAWALAYVNGQWLEVDSTPAVWVQSDRSKGSFMKPISDFASYIYFLFSRWRWGEEESSVKKYLLYLLVPLILVLVWRIYSRTKSAAPKRPEVEKETGLPSPEDESGFHRIEKRLMETGMGRMPWETPYNWIKRLEASHIQEISRSSLGPILSLHYRSRFDPVGISRKEEEFLRSRVDAWLEKVSI
ncbi:MAG: transglutaminase domain-containing protein [Nitrospinae bacterium]|nr:transglutaminase domain-containing protein [Nitrospinota bacterium]